MSLLIDQTENELCAEINFWNRFISEWQETRSEPVHPRALEALDRAESRLEHVTLHQRPEAAAIASVRFYH